MKDYNPIADGSYIRERIVILKDLQSWRKMTGEERHFFNPCKRCQSYDKYLTTAGSACPCVTCEHCKTELQVDNQMRSLRRKYLEGGL